MKSIMEVHETGRHRYIVFMKTDTGHCESVEVKAINEYRAIFKALRGRFFMRLFLLR